jgi:hypothetical protein
MERISAVPLAKAHLKLSTVMTSIETSTESTHPICVTTSDDKKQYFDDVVVTVPLGWIKKHKDSIPQMSPRVSSAIDSISFGRLEKVCWHALLLKL